MHERVILLLLDPDALDVVVELLLDRPLPAQLPHLLLRRLEPSPDLLPQLLDREVLKVSLHPFDIIIYVHHVWVQTQSRLQRTDRLERERQRMATWGTAGPEEEEELEEEDESGLWISSGNWSRLRTGLGGM